MFGGASNVRAIQTVLTAKDRATSKLGDVEDAGDRAADSMERTEKRLNSATQALAATGVATTALGGGIAMLVSRFGRLDQEFQTIKTTSGATAEQMDQIRDAVKGVSTSLPVTLAQSTAAAKQLSYAGLSASETMAALSETSQLAVAGQMQAGQAAQTVARSLNAFELEADQTNAVVGALGQSFASSATNIKSLSQGLTEVQATANAAGLSVAETVGSLGLLASAGLPGSKAGTSLNAVLRRLTSGSGEASKALDELGLSMEDFTNSSGELQGITSIMTTLSQKMEGVDSQAEKIRIAQQLAGSEGARALLPLLNKTDQLSQKINNNLRAEIQGAIGDLAEMDASELEQTSQALGMEVSGETTTKQFISSLQQLDKQGESTAQIVSRLQVGLGLTGDAASLLAEDITSTNKSAEELAEGIGGVVTAEELAQKQTQTLTGQIQQFRSDLQVLGQQMYQGTKPAVSTLVGGLRAISTPLAKNETAARALGVGLVALTGATGLATVALGAHVAQLKIASMAQRTNAAQTYAGTAALKAHAAATTVASRAHWLLTASTSTLIASTRAKTASMWASVTSLYGSATAALADASAKGVATAATGALTAGLITLQAAMGPVGWLMLALAGGGLALASVLKFDLFGAGEQAGAILGWFGEKAGQAWGATKQLLGILYELGRIGAKLTGLALLAPVLGLMKLPGLIKSVGPKVKRAAMRLPGQIISGLDSLGPAKYALPVLGPLLAARDMITNPKKWAKAGRQIPSMIADGIAQTAGQPVDAVAGVVSDARGYLPFSPAKKGPLSDLDKVGPGFVSTIAGGIENERGQLTSVLETTLGATPAGMAVGAAVDAVGGQRQSQRQTAGGKMYDVTITNDITVEGGDGSTESSVEQAAETGTSTALDEFFQRLSRET